MAKNKKPAFRIPPTHRQSRITLVAAPTAEEPGDSDVVMFGTMKARGELNIECGACGTLVVDGVPPEGVPGVFFQCPSCERMLKLDLEAIKRELA